MRKNYKSWRNTCALAERFGIFGVCVVCFLSFFCLGFCFNWFPYIGKSMKIRSCGDQTWFRW